MTFINQRLHHMLVLSAACIVAGCAGGPEEKDNAVASGSIKSDTAARVDTSAVAADYIIQSEYEDPDRATWQRPDTVLARFGDITGQLIADIGAGTGYFTLRMAAKGADVVAIDIDSNFLEHIEERSLTLPEPSSGSIVTRVTSRESPSLAEREVDGVLIVNTAYFLPDRVSYFKQIHFGLKRSGKVVIVDYKPERSPVAPPDNLWIASQVLVNELRSAGFTSIRVDDQSLPYQYIISATKN